MEKAKFNDEIKATGKVDERKLNDLVFGYSTDLILGHGTTREAVEVCHSSSSLDLYTFVLVLL
jgi:hypothetical protein